MEPWIEQAINEERLTVRNRRLRGSEAAVHLEGYDCSCGHPFPGNVTEAQYKRHKTTAAAHTKKPALGSSTAAARTTSTGASSSPRFPSAPSAKTSMFAPAHKRASQAVAATVAAEESRQAELRCAPMHAVATAASSMAAVGMAVRKETEERVIKTMVLPQAAAKAAADVQAVSAQQEGVRRLAALDAKHLGQHAAARMEQVRRLAALDAEQFGLRVAEEVERVERQAAHDLERLGALRAERTHAEQAVAAAELAKAQHVVTDMRRVRAEAQMQMLSARYVALQSTCTLAHAQTL